MWYYKYMKHHAGGGAIYGLGVIGALIYSIQHASSLTDGLVGVVYSFFWPAVFVYKVLEMWNF
jgi:hypothetical protein